MAQCDRIIKIAGKLPVFIGSLLIGGSAGPVRHSTYSIKDHQSDFMAAEGLTSSRVKIDSWHGRGLVCFQYDVNCMTGPWVASRDFEPSVGAEISLTGYYSMVMSIMEARELYGNEWQKHYMALMTCQNLGSTTGHYIGRCISYPADLPFDLAAQYLFSV